MNDALADKLLAGIDRIEKRQAAYEVVVHRILGCLEIHIEKFERLIAEIRDPEANSTTPILTEILGNSKRQVELLEMIYEDTLTPDWSGDRVAASEELAAEAEMEAAGTRGLAR